MSIPVRCPNPACARLHRVKNRYAGKRGQCPACGTWMLVPEPAAPAPAGPAEEPTLWVNPEDRLAAPVPQPEPQTEEVELVEEEAELVEEPAVAVVPAAPAPPRFSWLAVVLFLLGACGIGAASAAPFLEQPDAQGSGNLANSELARRTPVGVRDDERLFALGVPLVLGFLALLLALAVLALRNFGLVARCLACLITLVAGAALTFYGVRLYQAEVIAGRVGTAVRQLQQEHPEVGELTIAPGRCLWVGVLSAGAATVLFLLGSTLMQQRRRSRLVYLLVMLLLLGGLGGTAVLTAV